jgi:hypothetical protein
MARRFIGAILLLLSLAARPAIAATSSTELWHDAFIVLRDTPQVFVLDPDSFELAATLDVGLVPSTLAVSVPLKLLVVADGVSSGIGFVDLGDGQSRTLPLDFVPQRILFGPDGTVLAVIDTIGGTLAFIDAAKRSVTARIHDLGSIREVLFSDDGRTLYVSDQIGLTAIHAGGAQSQSGSSMPRHSPHWRGHRMGARALDCGVRTALSTYSIFATASRSTIFPVEDRPMRSSSLEPDVSWCCSTAVTSKSRSPPSSRCGPLRPFPADQA